MKRISETFVKKGKEKKDGKDVIMATRTLIQKEDFVLNLESIERMEKNAQVQIDNANRIISEANIRLEECIKLREILNDK